MRGGCWRPRPLRPVAWTFVRCAGAVPTSPGSPGCWLWESGLRPRPGVPGFLRPSCFPAGQRLQKGCLAWDKGLPGFFVLLPTPRPHSPPAGWTGVEEGKSPEAVQLQNWGLGVLAVPAGTKARSSGDWEERETSRSKEDIF